MTKAPLRVRKPKRRRRGTTPVIVQVRAGTLVYHDGKQRGGLIDNAPKHLAMQWLKQRFVDVIYQPAGAGVASNAINNRSTVAQAAATTAPSLRESDDLRDTGTDPNGGNNPGWEGSPG
ncbi:hypothetical protein NJB18091_05780 [Mycobacterium marinum]|uniref:hypothetical protein n=1 Tax=Mycobacterium marinum TaxID=1781 RepID=UPI0021C2ACD7|nr:hypothetical protein [Mycobacterium marinum]GJP27827.1 hypothetical protein NJB18091_05780 [Mycobacterium marinum]